MYLLFTYHYHESIYAFVLQDYIDWCLLVNVIIQNANTLSAL